MLFVSVVFQIDSRDCTDSVSFLIDSYPQIASILNHQEQSALHVCLSRNALASYQILIRAHCPELDPQAEDCFGSAPLASWKKIMEQKRESSSSGFPHESFKTLLLLPSPYDQHQTCDDPLPRTDPAPPEQIQRLRVLLDPATGGSLLDAQLGARLQVEEVTTEAALSHILRVHDANYILRLMTASTSSRHPLDTDTILSSGSFAQACRAAQAVCTAVDRLAAQNEIDNGHGGIRNVFCCVRPPGHHIGTAGAVRNKNNASVTQGFCLLNNVAIGAAYARATYPCFQRVAIIDFDVHHGNGTEDCVCHLVPCRHFTHTSIDQARLT